ncbi:MAG: S8 family serine peptidase, partial [Acidobacteriota bacterium]|nr:S8 family serine peptidase [Acidobacteriota bacterium]
PMVTGAVALLLEKDPQLTPDQVKARLMKTAYKQFPAYSNATDPATGTTYSSQYDIFTVGAGYLDISAALNNTDAPAKTAMSPGVSYSSGKVTLSADASSVWGSSVIWGSSVVWGSSVFVSGSSSLWGSSAVWGSSTNQGFSVVWGSSVEGSGIQASSESASVAVDGEN